MSQRSIGITWHYRHYITAQRSSWSLQGTAISDQLPVWKLNRLMLPKQLFPTGINIEKRWKEKLLGRKCKSITWKKGKGNDTGWDNNFWKLYLWMKSKPQVCKTQESKISLLSLSFHLVIFETQRNDFLNKYFVSWYGLNSIGTDGLLRISGWTFVVLACTVNILIFSNTAHWGVGKISPEIQCKRIQNSRVYSCPKILCGF